MRREADRVTVTTTAADTTPVRKPDTGSAPEQRPSAGGEETDVFAGLLAAVQGRVGSRATLLAPRLHHASNPLGAPPADAQQERLDRMADRAHAEQTDGRSSRLDPRGGSTGADVGPRGQRLALERQELADRAPAEPIAKPGPEARPQHRSTTGDAADRSSSDPIRANARLAPQVGSSTNESPPAHGKAIDGAVRPTQMQTDPQPQRGGVTAGVESARSPAPPVVNSVPVETPKSANRPEPIARQIGRILAGRVETTQSARAVTGVEQAGGARTAAVSDGGQSPDRASGRGRADSQPAPTPSGSKNAESAGRSTFEQLVRSARLQMNPSQSTARLRLDPPELGWIRVEARVEGSGVHLSVQTENPTAGELIRGRLAQLETALEQHGLRIERFELVARGSEGQADLTGERDAFASGDDHPPPESNESAAERQGHRPAAPAAGGSTAAGREEPGEGDHVDDEMVSATAVAQNARLDVRV
ncbi:MAG: hypothetical protein GY778_14330 [bacterium]|nr:hypothetical protein [bacterium]